MSCTDARVLVSARLDGESAPGLDEHLEGCADCQAFAAKGQEIRRGLRFEPVGPTPDVATAVRRILEEEQEAPVAPVEPAARDRWSWRAAAAAVLVGAVIGASLVGLGDDGPQPVAAASLPSRVVAAQATMDGLHADLRLVEHGWHPDVPARRFSGTLDYRAPESLALTWRDQTSYPSSSWRPNDVRLVTDGAAWVASGVRSCPIVDLPDCTTGPEEEAVTGRPPFAADAPVPLELVVPVRSFASVDTATVVGEGTVAGRPTVEVTATAAQIGPLLDGLRPAGNLRDLHPTDLVALSLDEEQMVPVRLVVRASDEPDRRRWAALRGYDDQPGATLLTMEVVDLELEAPDADRFVPPAVVDPVDAGFEPGTPRIGLGPVPPDGFRAGRSGVIGGVTPTGVWSWSDGRAWVRLQATRSWTGPGLFGDLGPLVRPTEEGAYISADGQRVGVHGADLDLVVDGSVPTDALVDLALAHGVRPVALPASWPEQRSASAAEIQAALPDAFGLDVAGFDPPAGRLDGETAVLFTAGAGDRRLLLEQRPGTRISPPLGLDYDTVRLRGRDARYTPDAGRLEWVERGMVIVLEGTGLSRAELVEVAEGLA